MWNEVLRSKIFLKQLNTNSKTQAPESTKQMHGSLFGFTLCSQICVTHFSKINWFPTSERAESCIKNTIFKYCNGFVPLCDYQWKQIQYSKLYLFLNQNFELIWTKISHSIKNVKSTASFSHTLKKETLNKLCRQTI